MRLPIWEVAVTGAITGLLVMGGQQFGHVNDRLERLEQTPTPTVTHVITRDVSLPARATRSTHRQPLVSPRARRSPESHRWDTTAYCATGHRTASGVWPAVGMAATLDRTIPFGTRLRVPGYGVVTVQDRIGHGSQLDIYLGTGAACDHAARTWGRRHLTITEVPAS